MTATASVRLARPSDAPILAGLSRDYVEYGLGWAWVPSRVLRAIRDARANVPVIHDGGDVLGFGIMLYGIDEAHLSLLCVRPDHRRRGLGSYLLVWLEKSALTAGICRIAAEVRADNRAAIEFYRQQGYRIRGRSFGYYAGVLDAIRIEKYLCHAARHG